MSVYMAGEGRRLFGQTTPSELRDKFQMSVRMPIGVVGAITPWNFPIAIPAWKLAPALVCGNTVVLKPAEDTPLLAERFIDLLSEAGLPDGAVNLVHGYGEEAGERLVRHPDVPVITFTGSRETGVARDEGGGRRAEARPPRARRQERDHRDGRRRPRPGRRGDRLVGLRHLGAALHGRQPRDRAPRRLRRAAEAARRARRVDAARRRLGSRDRPRPGDQPRGARQDPLLHRHRLGRRGEAPHRRRGRFRRRARQGLLLPADDLRRRRAADADRAGGDLRPDHRADSRSRTSTRRSASRTGSGTASRPRSSRAT